MQKKKKLEQEIEEYCKLNNISDVEAFSYQCLLNGFNIQRYGISPKDNIRRQNGEIEEEKDTTKQEEVVIKKKRKIIVKNN